MTPLSLTAEGAELLDSPIGPAEHINERLLYALPGDERKPAVDTLRWIASRDDESLRGGP